VKVMTPITCVNGSLAAGGTGLNLAAARLLFAPLRGPRRRHA